MSFTSLYPSQGLQNFVDETTNLLVANSSMSAGVLGGSGQFRSSIVNRASIPDISQNLKPAMGVERVMLQQIFKSNTEFGPNGEQVWISPNDDRGLVRFAGVWTNTTDSNAAQIRSNTASDFFEITFYGTGLNLLLYLDNVNRNVSVVVDGGSPTTFFNTTYSSSAIQGRSYEVNQIQNIANGLSLGIHTVKVSTNSTNATVIYGYEVLNESSLIKTNLGASYISGRKTYTSAQDASSYTGAFTNTYGVAGTKGGHVLIYQASDGTIKRDIQYTDSSQLTLSSADHSNEEIVQIYNFAEFGAGRSDDFSTLNVNSSAANRAYAIEDGCTLLVAQNAVVYSGNRAGIGQNGTSDFVYITFVGTGLDWVEGRANFTSFGTTQYQVFVDGTSIGSGTPSSFGWNPGAKNKVVSGLPYGTHTVRFVLTVTGTLPNFTDFIVYQPKKPALPSGAIELGDYNIFATFVGDSTTAAGATMTDAVSTGVLRRTPTREVTYFDAASTGTPWNNALNAVQPAQMQGAQQASYIATSGGGAFQYTFFGTGLELVHRATTAAESSVTITINGTLATAANFPTATYFTVGSNGYNTSTAVLNQQNATATSQAKWRVTGLPLGYYTIKFQQGNTTGGSINFEAINVITPIYVPRSHQYGNFQNSIAVGMCSLGDNRQNQPLIKQTAQKGLVQAQGVQLSPTTTSTTAIPMPDMSVTIKTSGGPIQISYAATVTNGTQADQINTAIYVNGIQVGTTKEVFGPNGGYLCLMSDSYVAYVGAGTHKVDIYWFTNAGTLTANTTLRNMTVREL